MEQGAAPGRSWRRRRGGGAEGGAEPGLAEAALRGLRNNGMRLWRATGLAGLAAVLLGARCYRRRGRTLWGLRGDGPGLSSCPSASLRARAALSFCMKLQRKKMDFLSLLLIFFSAVALSRAQVQQEPSAETSEGTGVNITCSHNNIQLGYYIQWYSQLPGRGPAFLVSAVKGSKEVLDPVGRLSVSEDRRSSALWLSRPRLGDAAVYYCVLGTRGEEPGLRLSTNRFGRSGDTVPSGPAGGDAAPPAGASRAYSADLENVPRTARHPPE
ncbi:uncharacterized protein LOC107324950 [Coturnix japonica]|uniref:uncharacterized protein LOC107324950 n=1 Tax=Coturnix japonica TaxID=93934 RepID=UPI0013A5CCD6|nr:uncharacterized protein LOC107324950 [Coturnix japonica]